MHSLEYAILHAILLANLHALEYTLEYATSHVNARAIPDESPHFALWG